MLDRLKNFIAARSDAPGLAGTLDEAKDDAQRDLAAATAALMIEAALQDGEADAGEIETVVALCIRQFGFSEAEAREVVADAEQELSAKNALLPFTRTIKEHADENLRVEIIEMLWEVAYADGELHDFEANLLRRVAGLIYVSDRQSGEARKRVLARLGIAG